MKQLTSVNYGIANSAYETLKPENRPDLVLYQHIKTVVDEGCQQRGTEDRCVMCARLMLEQNVCFVVNQLKTDTITTDE